MSNLKTKLENVKTARTDKAPVDPSDNPNDPVPYAVTVVEEAAALTHLQNGAHDQFQPESPIIEALANQLSEQIWTLQRLGVIHHQSLSFDIELNYDKLKSQYPNADASMHTIAAWKSNQTDVALRRAFTDQNPVTNRVLRIIATLNRTPRRRS